MVLHAVRPRCPVGRAHAAAAGDRPRCRDVACARRASGRGGRRGHRGAAGQDPSRGSEQGPRPRRGRPSPPAHLLRHGAERWRSWAADLARRFRASFWVEDARGRYPAIALDADKRPVDALTSNIGHLLGSGLLDSEEERTVADRLAAPDMDSGYGLRTMSSTSGGYWPLRYHGGSVWAHDTAIAIAGLSRSGHTEVAVQLAEGLLAAGEAVGYRMPELYSGAARGSVPTVVPYPAACRPQAWSAAAAVSVLAAALGLKPDVPNGLLRLEPPTPSLVGAVRAAGLTLAGRPLTVQIDAHGTVVDVDVDHGA